MSPRIITETSQLVEDARNVTFERHGDNSVVTHEAEQRLVVEQSQMNYGSIQSVIDCLRSYRGRLKGVNYDRPTAHTAFPSSSE